MAVIKQAPESSPEPKLTERELQAREDELKEALKLHASIASLVSEAVPHLQEALKLHASIASLVAKAVPLLEAADAAAEKLERSGRKAPVLRAAMAARRLAVPILQSDIRKLIMAASRLSSSVTTIAKRRKQELEEAVRDPELLR